ncbi:NAD-P-binding protein [Mycena latifolia]|nr:NAD-P-binding protein [Mycena latifolia]
MSTGPRAWLITGASSGFGSAMTDEVLANGEIAVATLRTPTVLDDLAAANPDHLLVKSGRVDVVFNNAGYAIIIEIGATPEDAARAMFEVNFWGAAAVSKEAVRVFRDVNPGNAGGRLLNLTSGAGLSGVAILGMYAARHSTDVYGEALEGLTESLRLEMNPAWNIKACDSSLISIIGPGAFTSKEPSCVLRLKSIVEKTCPRKFSMLDSPPVRWAMGKDVVFGARAKATLIAEESEKYESLSENLELAV